MNRRSFIGLVLGAAAAVTLRAAKQVEPEVATWDLINPIGTQISYVTRRSLLAPAYAQIYNTSPILVGLVDGVSVEDFGDIARDMIAKNAYEKLDLS